MTVRYIERSEFTDSELIKSIAFARKAMTPRNDADDPDVIYKSIIGCFDEQGHMAARARNIDYTCTFDGKQVPMTGLSGVASLPQTRNQGYVRAIARFAFEQDRKRGVVFNSLFPFSHAYYRRFGYEIASEQQLVRIPTEDLSGYARLAFTARMHKDEDGYEQIRAISSAMNSRYNLGMHLNDRQFLKSLGGDALLHGNYRFILYRQEKPCAYLLYTDNAGPDGVCTAEVEQLEFVDDQALLCALGFLYRLRARYQYIRFQLPSDISFLRLLPEPKNADLMLRSYGMARILNVETAILSMRHPKSGGQYVLCVHDGMIPDNEGVYTVTYADNVMVEKKPERAPDLSLDIGTLTQLVLGYSTLAEALIKTGVEVHGNEQTLSEVFIKKPTYLSFHF